jgi:uncharacterized membrane protein YphA (DoxX/SURF4 family)
MNGTPSWGLVLVRIVVGFILLVAGVTKLRAGVGEELVTGARDAYAASPEVVRSFGENVVMKHPWFFSQAVVFGEIVCGLCLFLGMLTRPAGFVAAILFANGWFTVPESQRMLCLLLAVCCFACAISRAGRRSGADVFLDERLPWWLTWSRREGRAAVD